MAEEEITQTKLFGEGMMRKEEWYVIREMSRRAIVEAVMNIRYVDTWALVEIIERDLMPDARAVVFGMDMKVVMGGFIEMLEELLDGTLVVKGYKVQELSITEVKKMNWKMLPIKGYWKTRNMVKKLWNFTKNIQLRKLKETFTVVVWNEDHGGADGMVWKDVIKAKRVNNTQLLIQTKRRKIYLPMFNIKRYEIVYDEDEEIVEE